MQRNDIILPTAVSHLKETMTRVECLGNPPEPDGYLTKFMMIESTHTFQGVALRGSLQGQTKRGRSISESFQSEMETAVNFTTQGLYERFNVLLGADKQPSDVITYGPKEVISDMLVFNADSWPTLPSDLTDYGREEIGQLDSGFAHFRESRL